MQDPVADMLTQIRNAQQAKHSVVSFQSSILKEGILKVLKQEGFIADFTVTENKNNSKQVCIQLKYFKGKPVIDKIKRISRPGLRIYKSVSELKPVPGFGLYVLSTSKGVMSHAEAKKQNIGGEVLCEVA